ncbi:MULTISPECIES: hypothetical protein [Aurantimonas]|uniref:hypothetical protein n=1 Tax=Aurantimonas TaxID=182269 RepID=UPI003513DC22
MARAAVSRLDPFAREFTAMIDDLASPEARTKRLADVARDEIAVADAINRRAVGSDVPRKVFVDGREGAPLMSVKPGGMVFAEWEFVGQAIGFIWGSLMAASPTRSGRYRASHLLIIDGIEHNDPASVPETFEEAVFINSQPYARKIERGLSRQAPDGVFQTVAAVSNRRFGNLAKVKFTYRPLTGQTALDSWAQGTSLFKVGRRTMSNAEREEWLRRQPAIVVTPYGA